MTVDLASPDDAASMPVLAALDEAPDQETPRLPVWQIVGLAGSGVFAFWTSLTCFVC
ncbi:MAG: hypothetical protein NVS3B26_23440 [Mycobacteriales bacterium]